MTKVTVEELKPILKKIYEGMGEHEKSYDEKKGGYTLSLRDAMIKVCDGDEDVGDTLYLFSAWWNDIQETAIRLGAVKV